MNLSLNDRIEVFQMCSCIGQRMEQRTTDKKIDCDKCNNTGQVKKTFQVRDLLKLFNEELGKELRRTTR